MIINREDFDDSKMEYVTYPRKFKDMEAFLKWRNKNKYRGIKVKAKPRVEIHKSQMMRKVIELVVYTVEFPYRALDLIGDKKIFQRIIRRLSTLEFYRSPDGKEEIHTAVLVIYGQGDHKFVRLHKKALPILEWLGLSEIYQQQIERYTYSGNEARLENKFRRNEVIALMQRIGIEFCKDKLPTLQTQDTKNIFSARPMFYPSKELDKLRKQENKEPIQTQMAGVIFTSGQAFPVYNTRNTILKWQGLYEKRMFLYVDYLARRNASVRRIHSAIVFVGKENNAEEFIRASTLDRGGMYALTSFYKNIYAVPLDENGARMLRILAVADGHKKLEEYFCKEEKSISFLDGNMVRLMQATDTDNVVVYCYPHQGEFIEKYLSNKVKFREVSLDVAEVVLGVQEDEFKIYEVERELNEE